MIVPVMGIALLAVIGVVMKTLEVLQEKRRQREANWNAIEADESLYVTQWFKTQCVSCNAQRPRVMRRFNSCISTYGGPSLLRVAENKGPLLPEGEVITLQRCFTCGAVWRVRQYGCFRRKA